MRIAAEGSRVRRQSCSPLLFRMDFINAQVRLCRDDPHQSVAGGQRQAKHMQALPDADAFLRIMQSRRLGLDLLLAQGRFFLFFELNRRAPLFQRAGKGLQNTVQRTVDGHEACRFL